MGEKLLKKVAAAFIFYYLLSGISVHAAPRETPISLLYFFSSTCPHCKQTTPILSELSREYPVQGLLFGKEKPGPLPFPVKKGTRGEKDRYQLRGIPSLVILKNGVFKQTLSGEKGIGDAKSLLRAYNTGALSVSEAMETISPEEILITGWLESTGAYFQKDTKFILTDRSKSIQVAPWLPLEAIKSRIKRTRPRMMSDVLGKPVLLRGRISKAGESLHFIVREELPLE